MLRLILFTLTVLLIGCCTNVEASTSVNTCTIPDAQMVRIKDFIPDVVIDLKYATNDNFTGQAVYREDMPACLRYGTIKKLIKVSMALKEQGYSLVVWDAFRPISCQYKLWNICPDPVYVANPNVGYSNHSRGNAIDVSIISINGEPVPMPTGFDDFTDKANRDYDDIEESAKDNALKLEQIMIECGFKAYFGEWWHFSDSVSYEPYYKEI